MFADEDQFWEYSKTSLRIWGTKATWPFESFEASCALNIGFVTGDNLEAIGGAVHVGRGKKKRRQGSGRLYFAAHLSDRVSCTQSRVSHTDA